MSQNLPRFHEVHGNDVMLYHDWTTAKRINGKENGLVFSSHPIKPNEKISIKLIDISEKLSDILSIGFTSQDPSSLRYDLPKCDQKELKHKPGYWICSLSKDYCVKNKILFFYATASGNICYGMDGVEKGSFDKKVDTEIPLWALINIWSSQTTVQLVNELNPHSKHKPIRVRLTPMMLHQTRGRNVKLTRNLAHKVDKRLSTCYTFTSRPLYINEHVVVKILDVEQGQKSTLRLGVTSCDPASLQQCDLPDSCDSFLDREEYWVVISDPLWNFKKKDEISFLITREGEMKIGKNGSGLLKVVHVDQSLKLWAFFDINTLQGIEVKSCVLNELDRKICSPSAPKWSDLVPVKPTDPSTATIENRESSECAICYENAAEAALYPCGHMCMCYDCARLQWRDKGTGRCPMCRAVIKDVIKIYKS
ncbi:neuralized-like [Asbolus verrucosus]|uniref:Neuralized-like n=1 Tax=Asbolus verrucosus TaxID=1661398 RepID=A0A482VSI1_ASBVE|nr:neuralized-like [Asbolus verrucosus]